MPQLQRILPRRGQIFFRVGLLVRKPAGSGFDRGGQCPAGKRQNNGKRKHQNGCVGKTRGEIFVHRSCPSKPDRCPFAKSVSTQGNSPRTSVASATRPTATDIAAVRGGT